MNLVRSWRSARTQRGTRWLLTITPRASPGPIYEIASEARKSIDTLSTANVETRTAERKRQNRPRGETMRSDRNHKRRDDHVTRVRPGLGQRAGMSPVTEINRRRGTRERQRWKSRM